MKSLVFSLLFGCLLLQACKKEAAPLPPRYTLFAAGAAVGATVEAFRTALGPLNTGTGQRTGRREVNWDAVPDSLLNSFLPARFFNPVGEGAALARQRGLQYDEASLQVSATAFLHLNAASATEFGAFSGHKVFANTVALQWPVGFEVAGESTPASVSAFGMVFSDVDKAGSTQLHFFEGNEEIGRFAVPVRTDAAGFSFLGVQFHNRRITRVLVTHEGRLADGAADVSQGGAKDLVVMDDLIYAEPVRW